MASRVLSLGLLALGAVAKLQVAPQTNAWAVIAVGSSGYDNYRHQADGCHAYQVLRADGVPAEQIILMMADDVANDPANIYPGKLFNKEGDNVTDVYDGCVVDYRGSDVTAALFLKVITGDSTGLPAGSKVLRSGPNDKVFLNFIDHGGVGIVAFPYGPFLYVSDLSSALQTMKTKQMFNELVFYMEACESGSMFPDLTADGKILAVTAANADESSWGYYCSPNDDVNGQHLGTCLGDLFSIAWMEDSDLGQGATESFATQIKRVTARTTQSHVSVFGDTSFEGQPISGFEAKLRGAQAMRQKGPGAATRGAVDSRDIALHTATFAWQRARITSEKEGAWQKLQQVVAARAADEHFFQTLAEHACSSVSGNCAQSMQETRKKLVDMQCHKALASIIDQSCPRREASSPGGWNSFNMKYSQLLVNLCESQSYLQTDQAKLAALVATECAAACVPGADCGPSFGGFWTDPNHYKAGSLAGTRYITDEIGNVSGNHLTLVGSDDGIAFWSLQGEWTNKAAGELTVDFSPKGGPADLKGNFTFRGGQIVWQDGNHWPRFATPNFSFNNDPSGRTTIGGIYYDPAFPGLLDGTFEGSRMVTDEIGDASGNQLTLIGSDDNVFFWSAKGHWVDKAAGTLIVDFSPKGGPANLAGTFSAGTIHWADGNRWTRQAVATTSVVV